MSVSRAYHIRVSILFLSFFAFFFNIFFRNSKRKKYFQNTDTYPSHHKSIFNFKDENFITYTQARILTTFFYSLYITRENLFYTNWKGFDYAYSPLSPLFWRKFAFGNAKIVFESSFINFLCRKVEIENSGTCYGFSTYSRDHFWSEDESKLFIGINTKIFKGREF